MLWRGVRGTRAARTSCSRLLLEAIGQATVALQDNHGLWQGVLDASAEVNGAQTIDEAPSAVQCAVDGGLTVS